MELHFMSLKLKLQSNYESLEKGAIAITFFSVLLNFLLGDSGREFTGFFQISGLFLLWFLYFSLSDSDYYRWPLGFLVFYVFASYFLLFSWEGAKYLDWAYIVAFPLFSLPVFSSVFTDYKKNASFELLSFLLGVFILLKPLTVLVTVEEFEQFKGFYNFGLAFIIATIIYNDNLWDRYSFNGKNTLKLIFVITLSIILSNSLKSITL
jgi:hypothetical protein